MFVRIRIAAFLTLAALSFVFVALPGCTGAKKGDEKAKEKDKGKDKDKDKDAHGHGETGPNHGGAIVEWEPYHAEVFIDNAGKMAIIYLLDDKAEKAADVDPARITKVKLTITSETPPITIELTHDAKKPGLAFTGTHDFLSKPAAFKADLTGTLDEKSKAKEKGLADTFEYDPKKHGVKKNKSAALRELYLTPGGLYTLADIKANGNITAAEKFKGKVPEHGDKKIGDKICPITNEKAESEFSWIVQDQRYEFCCPPCVDKFMRWAHHEPQKVKNATEYVFKQM